MASTAHLLKSPYARYLPIPKPGQDVRLTASDGVFTERVWVEVRMALLDASGRPSLFMGRVRSMSYNVEGWEYGDSIIFSPEHVQEILGWRLY